MSSASSDGTGSAAVRWGGLGSSLFLTYGGTREEIRSLHLAASSSSSGGGATTPSATDAAALESG
eukprot:CAMPEP_0201951992 /NCGR_PEP_ID=MMETSP0904-20121228/845_1 /ASSEMBLY_ACC=CAM_ASM_000553 /TAXON_ID=420261 /ORGANISM="Thalassiosira antarctica, Strain CCMP982" /LENGTH=64 /DNA_ID=CAMNT_0048495553 /DNA_START=171 /DNA_END=360 /DNA_ORIENTATION=-